MEPFAVTEKTILLVEDEALVALAERRTLEQNGYRVVQAASGEEAVSVFDGGAAVDLVLMDINLGSGIDGTEAAERILKDHDVPVVFLSSHTDPAVVERTERITSYGYIVKNSGDTVLLASLRMAFRLYQAHASLRESNERLRASQSYARTVVETTGDGFLAVDARGVIVDVNPAYCEMTGYRRDELVGMRMSVVDDDDDDAAVVARYELLVAKGTAAFRTHHRRKDGAVILVDITLAKLETDAGFVAAGFVRDVTERDRLLTSLLEQVPGAIYQYRYFPDGSSRFPFASPNIRLVYEVTPEEVKEDASTVFARVHPEDLARVTESILESYRRLTRWECEYRVVLPARGERWLRGLAQPQRLADASVLWHGFITDITELREAESAARRNELRWHYAVEGAGDGLWDWDVRTNEVYFSPRWKSMLGYEDHELGSRLEEWSERVHPDDRERTMAALNRHLDGETSDYSSEHRLRCKDGSYRWILDRGRVISRTDDGSPVRAIGTHTDITGAKEAERRIRRLVEEKDNLLHEVHHRIKNSFASVEALLQISAAEATSPETRAAILAARSRVASTRVLYETLLQTERYRTVPVHAYLSDIVHAAIKAGGGAGESRINLDLDVARLELSPRTAFPVGAIVTELVTNSLKYAFGPADTGLIRVSLRTRDHELTLTVEDDGTGFAPSPDGRGAQTHGLALVEMMANQLDGEFRLRSEPGGGTRATVTVPLPDEAAEADAGGAGSAATPGFAGPGSSD